MGTRSRVAVMHGDVIKSVYCHFDGYLKHTGTMLHRYYDSVRANELVARGDNSGVQQSLGEMNFYANQEGQEPDWAVAHSLEEFLDQVSACGAEYYYIMKDGVWYAGCTYATEGLTIGKLTLLADALADLLIAEAIAEDE
jgi:hypothetical protein